jgi:cobalt-zinc-cadmium efflux system membrane fusion protein
MNRTMIAVVVTVGCGGHSHQPEEEAEPEAASFTTWSSTHEYFAEYPPFVVGQPSALAAHVTRLAGHDPVASGRLTVILQPKVGAPIEVVAAAPARPGIFRPELTPTAAGACTLVLRLEDGTVKDEITTDCEVRAAGAPPAPASEEPPGRITFLKETAWSTDFATAVVGSRELVPTLRTTGEIHATAGREARITATAHGRVVLATPAPILGTEIAEGQVLARIVPQVDGSVDRVMLDAEGRQARAELSAAESQLARSERLWAARTIPERQLEESRTRVEIARSRTDAARRRLGQFDAGASGRGGGRAAFQVRSPLAGTLITTEVSSGQTVEDGELLFTVVDLDRVWLHADVFEPDVASVAGSTRATFRVDGYDDTFSVAPPDGTVVTIGQHVDEKTRTVPVIFELSNPGRRLRIGSFATVWIATGDPAPALAVPETAIVDDAGRKVAYVQVEGESFERRVLALGVRSGGWVEVKAGLVPGEHVVTTGAYDIKLAASGGSVPEHGHAH